MDPPIRSKNVRGQPSAGKASELQSANVILRTRFRWWSGLPNAIEASLNLVGLTLVAAFPIIASLVGAWLSLVERSVRDREVGGSNPLAPTKHLKFINKLMG